MSSVRRRGFDDSRVVRGLPRMVTLDCLLRSGLRRTFGVSPAGLRLVRRAVRCGSCRRWSSWSRAAGLCDLSGVAQARRVLRSWRFVGLASRFFASYGRSIGAPVSALFRLLAQSGGWMCALADRGGPAPPLFLRAASATDSEESHRPWGISHPQAQTRALCSARESRQFCCARPLHMWSGGGKCSWNQRGTPSSP